MGSGAEGVSLLAAILLGFGVLAGLLVGGGWAHRLMAAAITTIASVTVLGC